MAQEMYNVQNSAESNEEHTGQSNLVTGQSEEKPAFVSHQTDSTVDARQPKIVIDGDSCSSKHM